MTAATLDRPETQTILREHTAAGGRVDAEAGIIRGVRILGRTSKNNREYSESAMADVARLAEGSGVFVDHPAKGGSTRSLRDKVGVLENCRLEAGVVLGDLRFLRAHDMTAKLVEAAQTMPHAMGLSINASGSTRRVGNREVVESVEHLASVDLVHNPATNKGLFESILEDGALMPVHTTGMDGADSQERCERLAVSILTNEGATRAEKLKMFGDLLDAYATENDLDETSAATTPDGQAPDEQPRDPSKGPRGNRRANFMDPSRESPGHVTAARESLADELGLPGSPRLTERVKRLVEACREVSVISPTSRFLSENGLEPTPRRGRSSLVEQVEQREESYDELTRHGLAAACR